jgi:hypothetical protein
MGDVSQRKWACVHSYIAAAQEGVGRRTVFGSSNRRMQRWLHSAHGSVSYSDCTSCGRKS